MSNPSLSDSPVSAPQKISTRSAGVVALAVMCSRVLGLGRELILARLFGAGFAMDAFVAAFRLPNLLRDLFAEGALSTAFVTTFSKKIKTEGDESAWALANKVATLAAIVLSLLTILGMLLAPQLIGVLAGGFSPEKREFTVLLARIMFPFIVMVSLAALVMGMLNAKNVFGVPAMASSFFNLGSIVGGVSIGWWIDPHFGERALIGLAVGTLIGGTLQLVMQFPALSRAGFRFRPDFLWNDPGVRTVLQLMLPAVIAASAVQVNVMVNGRFASGLGDGPVSWLSYAFRLMQLPLGLFGVAIGTVTLPLISRSAAAGNTEEFRSILARGMRLAFLLTVPSTVGLVFLARPIISLIYERGKFSAASTDQTAAALQFYALGLVAYSGIKVLAPAFYAIDKRKTPMLVSFGAIGTNLVLNWLFTFKLNMGHRGLALSTGCVALTNFLVLYFLMRKETKRLGTRLMAMTLGKLFVAVLPLAAVCWVAQNTILAGWSGLSFPLKSLYLFATIGAGSVLFFGSALLLRIDGLEDVTALLRRKLGRFIKR
ncbi:MAG: virulence factor MviN [Chthoniobacteraceae bacterium]|nr:virulence factor MviN [Chthoniobacteraceae bacterium]